MVLLTVWSDFSAQKGDRFDNTCVAWCYLLHGLISMPTAYDRFGDTRSLGLLPAAWSEFNDNATYERFDDASF